MEFALNRADGVRIAYRQWGAGRPVVMVHGTALSQAIWRGFGYVRELVQHHHVVTLDLRGHGRSGKPADPAAYTTELFVGDVLAVLDEIGIPAADYVGYSLGGRVGFSAVAAHATRFGRFVSIGGAPRTGPGSFDRVFFPGCIGVLENSGMTGFLSGWEAHSGEPLDASTRAAFLADDAAALAAFMRAAERDPGVADSVLAQTPNPTLLLAGSADPERLRAAEAALEVMPDARLEVLAGATHASSLSDPASRAAVLGFLGPRGA
jgi:pimeloyl-ACP methyl ester carboxylesterase